MYLFGISVRKVPGITDTLSRVRIGKNAVIRIAPRLEGQQRDWWERSLEEKRYPYLYLDATYLKVRWGQASPTWPSWRVSGWMRRVLGRSWRWRWPPQRRGRPTPRCCEATPTGALKRSAPDGLRRPRMPQGGDRSPLPGSLSPEVPIVNTDQGTSCSMPCLLRGRCPPLSDVNSSVSGCRMRIR